MTDALVADQMIAVAAEDGDRFVAGLLGRVHADAALQVSLEGHHGTGDDVLPVRGDLEGGLFLLFEVLDVGTNLVDAFDERRHVAVVEVAA